MELLLPLLLLIVAVIPAKIAQGKGRTFWPWYLYAVLFWLVAMIHSVAMEDQSIACPGCGARQDQNAVACGRCGASLARDDDPVLVFLRQSNGSTAGAVAAHFGWRERRAQSRIGALYGRSQVRALKDGRWVAAAPRRATVPEPVEGPLEARIRELQRLEERGLLSTEEFDAARRRAVGLD